MAQTLSLSDAISGYQSGLTEHAKEETKEIGAAKDVYEGKMAEANKAEESLDPNALTPPKLTPPPQPKETSPVEVWGSSAMMVAGLGGLLTRRPLINSLNAMGGVINAYRQADQTAAQKAYDEWKVNTENAVKMAQFSIDAYKTALSKIETDKKTAQSDFLTTAKALGDENAAYVATHYGIDAAISYVNHQQEHLDRMRKSGEEMNRMKPMLDAQVTVVKAIKELQAARQSGDPAKIAAATQKVKDANELMQGVKGQSAAQIKAAANAPLYDAATKEIDTAIAMVETTPTVVGLPGRARQVGEAIGGWTGVTKKAPAQAFESQIKAVQASVRNLVTKSHYMSAGAVEQIDDLVKGLGTLDTPESAKESLAQIKDILNEQRGLAPEESEGGGGDDLSGMSDDELLDALKGK